MKDRKLTAHEMGRLTPEEYRNRPESGIVVVLDNVRSAYNVGSAFRSADAFGADKMWLCGICATPPSAEIHKTALGAEDSVPWEHSADTLQVVRNLQSSGYTVIAVEQTINSVKLCAGWQLPPSAVSRTFDPTTDCVSGPPTPLPWAARASGGTATPAQRLAFVFGNEVDGVQQEVVDECDLSLEIPQRGTKHSLNVSVTVGIVLFALTSISH